MTASTASPSTPTRYREIERHLRELVAAGSPGEALPSEAELCSQFSVSRMTVRQALQDLTTEGSIVRQRGRGTFIGQRPVHRRPGLFLSFTEEMARRGLAATSRVLQAGLDAARPVESLELQLPPGGQIVRLVRVRLADGVPVALEDAALRPEHAGLLAEDLTAGSLHAALRERGLVAKRSLGTITARLARPTEVEALDLPPSAALLVEVRLLFDQRDEPFERTETRYVAERYVIDSVNTHP